MFGALTAGLLGLAIGARHALEPDHLAAVCTVVADPRTSRRATSIGAAWGLGHAAALVGVGTVALCARARLPIWLGSTFELGVAVMLLALGVRGLRLASKLGRQGPELPHRHAGVEHVHAGPEDHLHAGRWTLARRPFLIGVVHGLAGSGALTAWAVASASTIAGGVLYIVSFGVGSIAGMAALTGALGASFRRWVRSARGHVRLAAVSGAISIVLSITWGYQPLLELAGL